MRPPALFSAFVVLVGAAWLMAVPPGAAPDEPAHYIKALATGQLDFYGEPKTATAGDRRAFLDEQGRDPASVDALLRLSRSRTFLWQQRTTRVFTLPSELVQPAFGCTYGQPERSGACLDEPVRPVRPGPVATYTGTYQPYVYLPSALVMQAGSDPNTTLRLGRLGLLLISGALLIAAAWLLWTPLAPVLSLLGLVAASSPMVLFLSSVLSPSGVEIAASICFAAALLRIARDGRPRRTVWAALAVSGGVLALARTLGPALVVVDALVVFLCAGPAILWQRVRTDRSAAIATTCVIAAATVASLVWEFTRQPQPQPTGESALNAVEPALSHLPELARQAVGVFGGLDAPMPGIGYLGWATVLGLVIVAAVYTGSRRDRLLIAGLALVLLGVVLVMSVVFREIGVLHGRYALPVLVLLPLVAGEQLTRNRNRLDSAWQHRLAVALLSLAGAVHALAWWVSARRFAVGVDGSWLFPGQAEWVPPLGWFLWVVVLALGLAALMAAGLSRALRRRTS